MSNKLNYYQWTGINKSGMRVKGKILSEDINDAQNELLNKGIEIIEILPRKELISFNWFKNRVNTKEVADFARLLSTLIISGMPIIQSFDIIIKDIKNEYFKIVILAVKENLVSGGTLSQSFKKYPNVFSPLFCNMIAAGEQSGSLDVILNRLATYLENNESLKSKAKRAMIYPSIIILVALVVSIILLVFIVPQFEMVFKSAGASLPYFTRMIMNISNIFRAYFLKIIILLGVISFATYFFVKRSQMAKEWIDKSILKIWIIGPLLNKIIIARLANTLAITLEAGLPIIDSLKSMSDIVDNLIFQKRLLEVVSYISDGKKLSVALTQINILPNFFLQMVAVGESSGKLVDMLKHIGKHYEQEVNNTVENLSNIIEPLIIIILGIVIGGFVVAMYLPIFKLGSIF